jgi:hypothetical protein
MAISPWSCGATLPVWQATFTDDSGNALNLTGATLSLIIHNTQTQEDVAGAGTWTITNATSGQATYAWAAADSAEPGIYSLSVRITFSGGGVLYTDPVPWTVNAA